MAIQSVYLANRQPKSYDRPMVYSCKQAFKEANSKKVPVLTPAIVKPGYSNAGIHDEYVAFPSKPFHIKEPIKLTYKRINIYINISHATRYRCVGIEVKDVLREAWIPVQDDFFETLLVENEFSENKNYGMFRNLDFDYNVTGKFKIQDGFLMLDLE